VFIGLIDWSINNYRTPTGLRSPLLPVCGKKCDINGRPGSRIP